jgi:hypothetical protein
MESNRILKLLGYVSTKDIILQNNTFWFSSFDLVTAPAGDKKVPVFRDLEQGFYWYDPIIVSGYTKPNRNTPPLPILHLIENHEYGHILSLRETYEQIYPVIGAK